MMCKLALILFAENFTVLLVSSAFAQYSSCGGVGKINTKNSQVSNDKLHNLITFTRLSSRKKKKSVSGTMRSHFSQCFIIISNKRYWCLWQIITKFLYTLRKIKPDYHIVLRFHKNNLYCHQCVNWLLGSSPGSSKVVFSLRSHTVVICIN